MSVFSTAGKWRLGLSFLVGVFCLSLFLVGIFYYVRWSKEIWEKDMRGRIMEVLVALRSSLENELYARIYYTRSVAAYVSLRPDIGTEEFHNLARELIREDEVINSMALSPNGVLSALYPKEGHEAAIGLDLFAHPERREIVEQTIRTKKTFVAGPVELVEGGVAFISYTPIFDKTKPESPEFWGVADIVILEKGLYEAAGLEAEAQGTTIALRGVDGKGAGGDVFFGDPAVFANDPVEVTIHLPDGEWILAGYPTGGWSGYLDQDRTMLILMIASSAIIAVLVGFLASAVLKLRASRRELERLNADKDQLLSVIAHDLRSPVSAVSGLSEELLQPGELQVGSEQREIVRMIHQSAHEGLLLLENLLGWVRSREQGEITRFEEIPLAALCSQVIGSFGAAAYYKSLRMENQIPDGIRVRFDDRVLETVLRNLLSNAVKFSPEGGTVRIRMNRLADDRVEVAVVDEGTGMSPARAREILSGDGLQSTAGTKNEKGTGIGLVLCRDLLRRCGESIRIESGEGEGTAVLFSLPVIPNP